MPYAPSAVNAGSRRPATTGTDPETSTRAASVSRRRAIPAAAARNLAARSWCRAGHQVNNDQRRERTARSFEMRDGRQQRHQQPQHREHRKERENACQSHSHGAWTAANCTKKRNAFCVAPTTAGNRMDDAAFTSTAIKPTRNSTATRLAKKMVRVEMGSGTRFI